MREPRPVTRIEVSEKNKKIRQILIIVLLAVAVVAITTGIMSVLNKDTGWQSVQITTEERNCSQNFIFQYNFSGSGAEATAVNKQLEAAYAEASVKAYQLFTVDEEIQGVNNIYHINRHVNEEITVDPVLYEAFSKLEGTRWLYLGPVYAHYIHLFYGASEEYVAQLDPALNADAAQFVARAASFAADEGAIHMELLGDNRIKLHVSQEYLAFAQAEEIENFIDFSYMTNAFVIDYLAASIQALGLTEGYFVSVDGYTRNLDMGNSYSMNLFDRADNMLYPAGVMHYRGPASIVYLKNYPTAESDSMYRVSGDHIVFPYVDVADGMYRSSTDNLVSYSYDLGCADVLLQILPSFIADNFAVPENVYSVWFEGSTLCYNDPAITVTDLLVQEDVAYNAVLKK